MDSQQYLPAFRTFNGIQLRNGKVRVLPHEIQEILIGTSDAAGFVHFILFFGPAFGIADFSGKIYVSGREKVIISQAVQRAFADHKGIRVVHKGMVERLPFEKERGNQAVEMADVLFRKGNALPCFGKDSLILIMRKDGVVETFLQGARGSVRAAIAHIGRLKESGAVFLLKIRTYSITVLTGPAETVSGASITQMPVVTSLPVQAGVISFAHSTSLTENQMVSHLLGNGCAVFAQIPGDLLKGIAPF